MLDFLSIGVFIDGGYYAKVNRALKARDRSIIRVKALFEYICSEIAMEEGMNICDMDATSGTLSEEAGRHWELSEIVDNNPHLKRMLLYRFREPAVTPVCSLKIRM